ncbi:unnamed protein product [Chironomus riparius]|uniref:Uncharacterized protein n=1 Tax=Chironomus riparius TaxID=315576 RepID=A0A9N9S4Q6_9DIPT|nr:unnamed protein product [Chironomus riparius]
MDRTVVVFIHLLIIIGTTASTDISCKFSISNDISIVGHLYQCSVDDDPMITTHESAKLTSVNGNHTDLKSNDNVTGFYAINKNIQHFPQNLDTFFPNLKLISIWACGLTEVHQNDLKNLTNLIYFDLISNGIEVIEEGLFEYNPKLEAVGLIDSSIVHIDHKVFDGLSHLKYLWLGGIPCLDINVNNSSEMVKEAIKVLKYNCTNSEVLVLEEEIEELKSEVKNLNLKDFGGKIKNDSDFGGKNKNDSYFGGKIKIDSDFGEKIKNDSNFGGKNKNDSNFGAQTVNLSEKFESFAIKYQNFDNSFKNSKFSSFRPLNQKYTDLNSSLNCTNCTQIISKVGILDDNLTILDKKIAARFEDLKFSQCGVKKFIIETKQSQNSIKSLIIEIKQKQLATVNGIMASSDDFVKKLAQLQTNQNKAKDSLSWAINQVKNKVGEIAKLQVASVPQIRALINNLTSSQDYFSWYKLNEVKIGQNEVKDLIKSKLNEHKYMINELKTSIIDELKLEHAENQKNLTQISLFFELTSKVDDLQLSMTQLSQVQNDTFEMLENQRLDQETYKISPNEALNAIEELKIAMNASMEVVAVSFEDLKATQETIVSSNEKIQQSLDDLVAKLSESTQSTSTPTQDNEINSYEDKFMIFEEKMSKKFEQNLKEAEERLMAKFEEVLEEKLGSILDKNLKR